MTRRPCSLPEYQWPAAIMTPLRLPVRLFFAALFHLAWTIGRIIRRFGRNDPNAICVIRTDGIGDAILFEPALRSLPERFAGASLHVWAPGPTCDLFAAQGAISRLSEVPRGAKAGNLDYFHSFRWRTKLGYLLGRSKFDVAIYAAHSPEPLGNWLFQSVDAREKWLNPGDTENQFDWQRDHTTAAATRILNAAPPAAHELIRNAHLALQWGGAVATILPRIETSPAASEAAAEQVRRWWRVASRVGATQLVGVMPASAMAVKGYPAASWGKVISDLWLDRGAMCVLLGGPSDGHTLDEIVKSLRDVPYARLQHGVGLMTVAAILPRLDALLSVDTGLAHLAIANDVPTVVLHTGGHPGRFFPWPVPTRSAVLNKSMPCEGCRCRCVLAQAECVTRIRPGEIIAAYLRLTHRVPNTKAA